MRKKKKVIKMMNLTILLKKTTKKSQKTLMVHLCKVKQLVEEKKEMMHTPMRL